MHIDDHTLELYVLEARSIAGRRTEIEDHLKVCHGCREFTEMVRDFYAQVDENLKNSPLYNSGQEQTLMALAKRTLSKGKADELGLSFFSEPTLTSYAPTTRIEKFRYFTRRHPVLTGSGAFALFAGLALLFTNVIPYLTRDINPSYYRYNTTSDLIEIRNADNELLWSFPADDLAAAQLSEEQTLAYRTIIADINGDGTNEVLTTQVRKNEVQNFTSPLRVFDGKKDLVLGPIQFTEPIRYLNRVYVETWRASTILVVPSTQSGKKDILVQWSCSRSPTVITRYDAKGNLLGEYWHFGQISGMHLVDAPADGKQEVILAGINDTGDSVGGEFGTIIVIDPERILGRKKSVCSQGYHMPASDAEIYYVSFPRSPIAAALQRTEPVTAMERDLPDALTFLRHTGGPEGNSAFEFIFNRDMSLRLVKSTTVSSELYRKLIQAGKLRNMTEQDILDSLGRGIRYWDGSGWRNDVTRVLHSVEAADMK